MDYSYQLAWHVDTASFPEWGSAPRGPLIQCDFAHKGELLDTVIGQDPATGKDSVYYILKCEYCILVHVWPFPAPHALDLWYVKHFYQHEKPEMLARYERDAPWWIACVHEPLLDTIAAAFPSTGPLRILDIGAGPGLFLRTAKARGSMTTAIEPSPLCAERLRKDGHQVWEGSLSSFLACPSYAAARYDVVMLYEMLEHACNPEDMLLSVWDLLTPGGLIMVVVPNDFNPLQLEACRTLGLPRYWLSAPAHLTYFTPKTLQLLVRRTGFTLLDYYSTYPLEQFLLDGHNYVGNDAVGRLCHGQRMAFELEERRAGRWSALMDAYRANLENRIGRELVCIARKRV